jgi:hypothetical protein
MVSVCVDKNWAVIGRILFAMVSLLRCNNDGGVDELLAHYVARYFFSFDFAQSGIFGQKTHVFSDFLQT